ncbi:prolyl 3-hydroxylase 1-like isoform X2 [Ceratina calcarata]|uniref:Prolyl 3-hydroxylase 1-like isoform X2 n=1 Tax=Ceratina calcarata TaxID=156304 RepID=A0AAJ7JAW0_9HYME|nr:prolyl 3-hydroxylase 1-like isoform X2 [Ceratina calcarata]
MMRLVIFFLFLFYGTINGNNDTLNNVIPDDDKSAVDVEDLNELNRLPTNKTLNELYEDAVRAYLDEDWDRCIENFNVVTHGYKAYKRAIVNCRQKCREKAIGEAPIFPENIDDLHFYEKKVRETLCLLTCNQEYREIAGSRALKALPRETEQKLMQHKTYEYLHICYYQRKRYQDAANALFTFLVAHPDHAVSMETLKGYLTLPGVQKENVINLESPAYVSIYFKGVSAYEKENYAEAAGLFETSLRSYLDAEQECRFYCEGPFDQGWYPEFTSSVANHFAFCLKCKRACPRMLNSINGDYRPDILRSHYNYLQFSYYKLGNLKAACSAVESYLLFEPMDETMLHNKEYYTAQPKTKQQDFIPRNEALLYVKRQEYEVNLMVFISHEFSLINAKFKNKKEENLEKELSMEEDLHQPPGRSLFSSIKLSINIYTIPDESYETEDRKESKVKDDIYLISRDEELGGKNRYVADGFLSTADCHSLMQLVNIAGVEGDGYNGNKSPHSKYEKFEGITVGRIALLVYFGKIQPAQLQLLLEKTEQIRSHMENHFQVDRHLYFTYTHLVCRTALPGNFHLMNQRASGCFRIPSVYLDENICLRRNPAYIWRSHSAILYLNGDFNGGEFFFAKNRTARELDNLVSPRCGRTVAFSAGEENLHGVRGVLRGRRCALALWFTQNEKYSEYERDLARAILKRVQKIGPLRENNIQIPSKYEDLLIEHAKRDESLKHFFET